MHSRVVKDWRDAESRQDTHGLDDGGIVVAVSEELLLGHHAVLVLVHLVKLNLSLKTQCVLYLYFNFCFWKQSFPDIVDNKDAYVSFLPGCELLTVRYYFQEEPSHKQPRGPVNIKIFGKHTLAHYWSLQLSPSSTLVSQCDHFCQCRGSRSSRGSSPWLSPCSWLTETPWSLQMWFLLQINIYWTIANFVLPKLELLLSFSKKPMQLVALTIVFNKTYSDYVARSK